MSLDTRTRELFFNGDILNSNSELVEFYKKSQFLSLAPPPEGYTVYPPLSALGSDGRSEDYIFRFKTHPFLPVKFREGELKISSRNRNNKTDYSEPALKFFFDTKEELELGYNKLVEIFSELSTRKRFSSYDDHKLAEFSDDNSRSIKEVCFLQGQWDVVAKGYVLVFGLGNDMDIEKQD